MVAAPAPSVSPWPALIEQLAELPDPRIERTRLHKLIDILAIAICAVICGADGWDDFVAFGRAKHDWLKERLGYGSALLYQQCAPECVLRVAGGSSALGH